MNIRDYFNGLVDAEMVGMEHSVRARAAAARSRKTK